MSNPPHDISALPFVVPGAVVVFALLLWLLKRGNALTALRAVVAAVICVYGAGILANTLFPIRVGGPSSDVPWRAYLHLTPLAGTETADMLSNVLVFMPLGFLVPLLARVDSVLRVLAVGFVVSLVMETLQFINAVTGHGGHIADINDLLANTVGAGAGYVVFCCLMLVPFLRRAADAAAMPTAGRTRRSVAATMETMDPSPGRR